MSLIRKHGAVLQAWACLDLVMLSDAVLFWLTQLTVQYHRCIYCFNIC